MLHTFSHPSINPSKLSLANLETARFAAELVHFVNVALASDLARELHSWIVVVVGHAALHFE